MTCCQTGEAKTHWVFFSHWHFFLTVWGASVKFFWGEDFGGFNHWDSAFPNSWQAPTYNQTCSRLPIDPVSSILDPRPVPLIILLFYACLTFHREIGGQTIETIKTLQTPAKYIRLVHNTQHVHHFLFQGPAPRHWLSPPYISKCLYVCMFICFYMFICFQDGYKYWILDIDGKHFAASRYGKQKKFFLTTKINFPVTRVA